MSRHLMFDECNLSAPKLLAYPTPWKPSDDSASASAPFFPRNPYKMMSDGIYSNLPDVPVMLGFNKHEGLLFTAGLLIHEEPRKLLENEWKTCFWHLVTGKPIKEMTEFDWELSRKYREKFFFNVGKPTVNNSFEAITDAFTDAIFAQGVDNMAKDSAFKT